jgi:hypothetical protein
MTSRQIWQSLVLTLVLAALAAAAQRDVSWTVSHQIVSGEIDTVGVDDDAYGLTLGSGWACTVGGTSRNLPAYEARTAVCTKGEETIEFTVQCEPSRPTENTQVRFRTRGAATSDFIEVACALK